MSFPPVILRELRSESRHPLSLSVRLIGAAGAILMLALMAGGGQPETATLGPRLFIRFHALVLVGIWTIGPLVTADCISRERREGTLGLLFLTPLKAIDIVRGKLFVHAWRMICFWLALAPVMVVPLILGGVAWLDVSTALALEFTALMLSVSAGVLASALTTKQYRSWLLAEAFGVVLALASGLWVSVGFEVQAGYADPSLREEIELMDFIRDVLAGIPVLELGWDQGDSLWSYLFTILPTASGVAYRLAWRWTMFETVALAALGGYALVDRAARRTQRSVREDSPSVLRLKIERAFLSPVIARRRFASSLREKLERNPTEWLSSRSALIRSAKWAWCALMLAGFYAERSNAESLMLLSAIPIAGLALESVISFHHVRDAGFLELMLVSPLGVRKMLLGTARPLLGQMLPAALVLAAGVLPGSGEIGSSVFLLALFCTTCVLVVYLGMYLSIRMSGTLVPWLISCVVAFGPLILARTILEAVIALLEKCNIYAAEDSAFLLWRAVILVFQCTTALFAYRSLVRRMNERTFAH